MFVTPYLLILYATPYPLVAYANSRTSASCLCFCTLFIVKQVLILFVTASQYDGFVGFIILFSHLFKLRCPSCVSYEVNALSMIFFETSFFIRIKVYFFSFWETKRRGLPPLKLITKTMI